MKKNYVVGLSISMILFSLANTIQADSISNSNTERATIHLNSMNNLEVRPMFTQPINGKTALQDNDIPGKEVQSHKIIEGYLNHSTYSDHVYRVHIKADESVMFTFHGSKPGNFQLHLYDRNTPTIHHEKYRIHSHETPSSYKTFTFRAKHTGYYYLNVHASEGEGNYKLMVHRPKPTPDIP
ncbi:hypothetical protein P4418_30075 [Bacillus thuringiensis]|nr:hypothetical protein [Bacillus thuringiensis]